MARFIIFTQKHKYSGEILLGKVVSVCVMCIHVLVRVCIRLHGKCHLNMNIKLKSFAWVCYVQCSKIEQRVCLSSFLWIYVKLMCSNFRNARLSVRFGTSCAKIIHIFRKYQILDQKSGAAEINDVQLLPANLLSFTTWQTQVFSSVFSLFHIYLFQLFIVKMSYSGVKFTIRHTRWKITWNELNVFSYES